MGFRRSNGRKEPNTPNKPTQNTMPPGSQSGSPTDLNSAFEQQQDVLQLKMDITNKAIETLQSSLASLNEKHQTLNESFSHFKGSTEETKKNHSKLIWGMITVISVCASHYFFNVISTFNEIDKKINNIERQIEYIENGKNSTQSTPNIQVINSNNQP